MPDVTVFDTLTEITDEAPTIENGNTNGHGPVEEQRPARTKIVDDLEALIQIVRDLQQRNRELSAQVEHLEAQMSARAEQEHGETPVPEAAPDGGISPADYEAAQTEINYLRRLVEVYEHDRLLREDTTEQNKPRWHPFQRS